MEGGFYFVQCFFLKKQKYCKKIFDDKEKYYVLYKFIIGNKWNNLRWINKIFIFFIIIG